MIDQGIFSATRDDGHKELTPEYPAARSRAHIDNSVWYLSLRIHWPAFVTRRRPLSPLIVVIVVAKCTVARHTLRIHRGERTHKSANTRVFGAFCFSLVVFSSRVSSSIVFRRPRRRTFTPLPTVPFNETLYVNASRLSVFIHVTFLALACKDASLRCISTHSDRFAKRAQRTLSLTRNQNKIVSL